MSFANGNIEKIKKSKNHSTCEWGDHKERTDSKRYKNDCNKSARRNSNKKDRFIDEE